MESPYKGKTGLQRLWNALGYSVAGLRAAYRNEAAFRQEIWLAIVLIPATWLLPVSVLEQALLIGVLLLVLIVELINSAIEATVDRISIEHHLLAKRAKDVGSAAVLLALINATVFWAIILLS